MAHEEMGGVKTVLALLEEQDTIVEEITLAGSLTHPIPALQIETPGRKQRPRQGRAAGATSLDDLRQLSERIRKTRPNGPKL